MSLDEKHCIPCSGGVDAMSEAEVKQSLTSIPGWEVIESNTKIRREISFSNFAKSLACVNKIGIIAEKEKHHPDINFGWGYCTIELQTHAIGGLHENDFIVAAKINQLLDT